MAHIEAQKVQLHRILPDFVLPSLQGKQVSVKNYKQRANLVVVYLDLNSCPDCADYLQSFADNYSVYEGLETQILVVTPIPIAELQSRLGSKGLPFPVLSDESGEMRKSYMQTSPVENPVGAVFVADRYGELRAMMFGRSTADLPNQQSIMDWLSLIETECPECGPGDEAFQKAVGA